LSRRSPVPPETPSGVFGLGSLQMVWVIVLVNVMKTVLYIILIGAGLIVFRYILCEFLFSSDFFPFWWLGNLIGGAY